MFQVRVQKKKEKNEANGLPMRHVLLTSNDPMH